MNGPTERKYRLCNFWKFIFLSQFCKRNKYVNWTPHFCQPFHIYKYSQHKYSRAVPTPVNMPLFWREGLIRRFLYRRKTSPAITFSAGVLKHSQAIPCKSFLEKLPKSINTLMRKKRVSFELEGKFHLDPGAMEKKCFVYAESPGTIDKLWLSWTMEFWSMKTDQ